MTETARLPLNRYTTYRLSVIDRDSALWSLLDYLKTLSLNGSSCAITVESGAGKRQFGFDGDGADKIVAMTQVPPAESATMTVFASGALAAAHRVARQAEVAYQPDSRDAMAGRMRAHPVGAKVMARFHGDGMYYPATVRAHKTTHALVTYDTDPGFGYDAVKPEHIRPRPTLKKGDWATADFGGGKSTQYPGVVEHGPDEHGHVGIVCDGYEHEGTHRLPVAQVHPWHAK